MYGKLLQARFLSHKDYILLYISIKFHVVVAKSASYAAVFFLPGVTVVVKTTRESQQLK